MITALPDSFLLSESNQRAKYGAASMLIAGIGKLFIHDKKAINNLMDGLLAAYLLAFFLSIILGGGTAFLYIPQMLSNALLEREASVLEHDELA